jgi:hypothetical protein
MEGPKLIRLRRPLRHRAGGEGTVDAPGELLEIGLDEVLDEVLDGPCKV